MLEAATGDRDLLCICCSFWPETSPTANRATKLLELLARTWRVRVVTAAPLGASSEIAGIERVVVPAGSQREAVRLADRLHLGKLADLFVWPDPEVLWAPFALREALRSLRARPASAALVFMMPYSSGLVGLAIKRISGLPLVLNLDDSPTCSDMHPWFPSPVHERLARELEDRYVQGADAVVYVSETTRARVASRLDARAREKLRVIRYGADPVTSSPAGDATPIFTIRYLGGMNGWHALLDGEPASLARRMYRGWINAGVTHVADVDLRSSSPVFLGRAVARVLEQHPEWRGRLRVEVHGNAFPPDLVQKVLTKYGVEDVVRVSGPVSYEEAIRLSSTAELLFMTLPARRDGSLGGRISAKTYEYLVTDRAVLAAVPPGENRAFLEGRPGVDCCDPLDDAAMERVVERAASAFFGGHPERFDRSALHRGLSYASRAEELHRLLDEVASRETHAPR